jgi:hypothetical protein
MREYGKVFSSIYESDDFRSLSEDGRTLVLYLLICKHATIAGVFRVPDGYVCEDLQWTPERVSKGFENLAAKGFATRCSATLWVWVTKFLEWNPPENPNQRKAAAKVVARVPDQCTWRERFLSEIGPSLGIEPPPLPPPPMPPAPNPSATVQKRFLNQEQEQKQEQEQEQKHSDADASGGAAADVIAAGAALQIEGRDLSEAEEVLLWNGALGLLIPSYSEAAGEAKQREAKARLFVGGLGKRIKTAGADRRVLFEAIQAACVERPINPETWLSAAVAERCGRRQQPNRQEAQEQRNRAAADDWVARKQREMEDDHATQ